ncbi:hypothetical protein [Halococcus hamelinensis]|uniref:Uncharacterized protein n=1 Tax=Halococcus hamelinensis 100A6 TaxID=1132509 RepID=M0M2Q2_9EURY|nr:hypothetical protein [Halococcus hamelinensis]EMA39971.1 hypothetical protein C447_05448 [Halococcus hamelinensis 100A6]
MTWTWGISGLGTKKQTLTVYDPDGNSVGSETREGWSWSDNYPDTVTDLMPETISALMAIQREDIERRSDQ